MTEHSYLVWRKTEAERDERPWIIDLNTMASMKQALQRASEEARHASALSCLRLLVLRACTSGFGFVLLRNFPIEPADQAITRDRFSRFGEQLGLPLSQDVRGEHLGELSGQTRGADWYDELPFHTDGSSLLLLLGIHPAYLGGLTKLVCAAAVLKTMQTEQPSAWQVLFEPWAFHRGNRAGPRYFERPIFSVHRDSTPDCFFLPGTIRKTPEATGIPLRPEQLQALDAFERIAERADHHIKFALAAGDLLVVNNNKVLHARTRYADSPNAPPRVLLRMWINLEGEVTSTRAAAF